MESKVHFRYLMSLFAQLQDGDLPLYKINFGVMILLPKKQDASRIEHYRPICLLNLSFKVFTKVSTNGETLVAHKVIRPMQSPFIPGRNILKGLWSAMRSSMKFRKKMDEVLFKIDFKKAYDKVKLSFLQRALRMEGFSPKWCE
jgi:hypothetical protein